MEKYFVPTLFAVLFVVVLASGDSTSPTGNTTGVGNSPGSSTTPNEVNLNPSKNSRLMEGPTQEAISACGGKNLGAPCTFTGPDALSATGTCTKPGKSALLACHETSTNRTVK
jgi:hypothetical protein